LFFNGPGGKVAEGAFSQAVLALTGGFHSHRTCLLLASIPREPVLTVEAKDVIQGLPEPVELGFDRKTGSQALRRKLNCPSNQGIKEKMAYQHVFDLGRET